MLILLDLMHFQDLELQWCVQASWVLDWRGWRLLRVASGFSWAVTFWVSPWEVSIFIECLKCHSNNEDLTNGRMGYTWGPLSLTKAWPMKERVTHEFFFPLPKTQFLTKTMIEDRPWFSSERESIHMLMNAGKNKCTFWQCLCVTNAIE